jgi:peptide/nickel transport system substrate-binding protein
MKYIEKVGDEEFKKHPSTIGLYEFVDQKYGEYIKLEATKQYYEHLAPGRPYTKSLTYLQVPEIGTRMALLKAGQADIMIEVLGPTIPEAKNSPGIQTVSAREIDVTEIIVSDYYYPDEPSPILDKRVRQALAYAINKEAIAQKLYFGEAVPQKIPTVATWEFGADPEIPGYPYDVEKAKALLKEAGYADGFKYKLVARPQHMQIATAVAGFWEAIGLDIDLSQIEVGVYQNQVTTKSLRGSWVTMVPTSGEAAFWHTIIYKKGVTWSWNSSDEIDAMIDNASKAFDLKEREKLTKETCWKVHEELPSRIPIIARNGVYAIGPRVKQFVPGFYNWWIRPEWLVMKD